MWEPYRHVRYATLLMLLVLVLQLGGDTPAATALVSGTLDRPVGLLILEFTMLAIGHARGRGGRDSSIQ